MLDTLLLNFEKKTADKKKNLEKLPSILRVSYSKLYQDNSGMNSHSSLLINNFKTRILSKNPLNGHVSIIFPAYLLQTLCNPMQLCPILKETSKKV